ncbi:MAG TPA: Fe3+-hydroxamate ABC transporter substrate-binding protein [Lachnoclostridium sp.]|jgi:iron complex transport system substrate-binding protein|uniref:ABC transporter substrate-binding protein n=1 Tax=Lacrimispora sp. TaxID=2719234 RepID=UPI000EBBA147|nr:ABC transporter substrate-binding protein [Lacrimispora sp.]HCD46647.1 Fe3+-hydroxamate ABC transporter substrate-binding protein [Lachnoclostridium sp.]
MKKIGSIFCFMFAFLFALTGCSRVSRVNSEALDTHTINTVMGDIEVPKEPQRVVVNWYIGDVLSLDLNVVGYYAWEQETMPFYDKFSSDTKLESWAAEDIMAAEPDLIITYQTEDFEKFGKIAPVMVIPEESVSSVERLRIIGEATGKAKEAEALIAVFEEKLAAAKEELQSKKYQGKTFSIMEDWGPSGDWNGVAYETGSRGGTLVYNYLDLKKPEKLEKLIEESSNNRGTLSYEVAHEYFGDYILWFQQEGKESEYAKTDIWKSIPAVAEGRIAEIPGKYQGLFYYSDLASLTAQLDYTISAIQGMSE